MVRNGLVITAADRMRADIGIEGGRIVALGERLGPAKEEIDGRELWVLHAMARGGYTSFKVLMTQDDRVLNDRQLLEVLEEVRAKQIRSSRLFLIEQMPDG